MRLPTRLRAQALALFLGVAFVDAAFSPWSARGMGYTNETMRACEQLLSSERPRVPPDFGVDWPRNGSTEVFLLCGFQALGRALDPPAAWEDRFASMQPVLATAAIATLVFVWASRLAGTRRRALGLALGAAFCTMLWPYAYIGMEPVQSLFLLAAGYLALEARPEPSRARTAAFSLCAAVKISCSIPASRASSTAYWISGRSTTVIISLGMLLVAGSRRVPRPATGKTALRTRLVIAVWLARFRW